MNLGLHIRNARSELTKVIFPTKGQVKQAYISVLIRSEERRVGKEC